MKRTKLTYASSGVSYDVLDRFKRLAQTASAKTATSVTVHVSKKSRGESAFVWEEKDAYRASVIEGLGTKNLVADEVRTFTKRTHYDAIACDTVAMIINDLIVVGAKPEIINAYFAVGNSKWFADSERSSDLINGWTHACQLAGVVWGGGETPTIGGIVSDNTIDLAGSAVGVIKPKRRLVLGDSLQPDDAIILIESSGIHANGLSLARSLARRLPKGYATKLSSGSTYGETLLIPTHIYANLVGDIFAAGIAIHYMVNITGHGWRKLMRAEKDFSYIIETIPKVPEVFQFIQKQSGNDDAEMYGTFNMGAGFAVYVAKKDVDKIQALAKKNGFESWHAGRVERGSRSVHILPKQIVYGSESLRVRS